MEELSAAIGQVPILLTESAFAVALFVYMYLSHKAARERGVKFDEYQKTRDERYDQMVQEVLEAARRYERAVAKSEASSDRMAEAMNDFKQTVLDIEKRYSILVEKALARG